MGFHKAANLALLVAGCAAIPTSFDPIYDEGAGVDGDVAGVFFSGSCAYAYGTFTTAAAGASLLRVARRDISVAGSAWQQVGDGIAVSSNLRTVAACLGSATAADVFAGGDTVVTGGWLNAGVLAVSAGGSGAFSLLPPGSPQGTAPVVTALACHRGVLVIGGSFTSCGGVAETGNICAFNGASFSRLVAQGAAWPVTGMRATAGTLYAMFASAVLMYTGSATGAWAGGISVSSAAAFAPADDDSALYICQADGNLRVVTNPVTGGGGTGATISPSFLGCSSINAMVAPGSGRVLYVGGTFASVTALGGADYFAAYNSTTMAWGAPMAHIGISNASITALAANGSDVLIGLTRQGAVYNVTDAPTGGTTVAQPSGTLLRWDMAYVTPSPSPSASASVSVSPSASPSASPSVTAASPSVSPSVTPSTAASPSHTPSASITASVTGSATVSASISPSVTGSGSTTPSVSGSASVAASRTPSPSITPSVSGSGTVTPTVAASSTVSPTCSGSSTVTPTGSGSATASSTVSGSMTASLSVSASVSRSPSISGSTTLSTSATPSGSATTTPLISPSSSGSVTPSYSPSITRSPSVTPARSVTPSRTPSVSPSPTPSWMPAVPSGLLGCPPPADERCLGWDSASGLMQCGTGYAGNVSCSACANAFFPDPAGSGRCSPCPHLGAEAAAQQANAVVFFAIGVVTVCLVTVVLAICAKRCYGGSYAGSVRRGIGFLVWAVLVLQLPALLSQSTRGTMPAHLATLYRYLRLPLLQWYSDVHPACVTAASSTSISGLAPQISYMVLALAILAGMILLLIAPRRKARVEASTGKRSLPGLADGGATAPAAQPSALASGLRGHLLHFLTACASLVYVSTAISAFTMLHCRATTVTVAGYSALVNDGSALADARYTPTLSDDGGVDPRPLHILVLVADPLRVCFEGEHRSVAVLAIATIALFLCGYPALLYWWGRRAIYAAVHKTLVAGAYGRSQQAWARFRQQYADFGGYGSAVATRDAESADACCVRGGHRLRLACCGLPNHLQPASDQPQPLGSGASDGGSPSHFRARLETTKRSLDAAAVRSEDDTLRPQEIVDGYAPLVQQPALAHAMGQELRVSAFHWRSVQLLCMAALAAVIVFFRGTTLQGTDGALGLQAAVLFATICMFVIGLAAARAMSAQERWRLWLLCGTVCVCAFILGCNVASAVSQQDSRARQAVGALSYLVVFSVVSLCIALLFAMMGPVLARGSAREARGDDPHDPALCSAFRLQQYVDSLAPSMQDDDEEAAESVVEMPLRRVGAASAARITSPAGASGNMPIDAVAAGVAAMGVYRSQLKTSTRRLRPATTGNKVAVALVPVPVDVSDVAVSPPGRRAVRPVARGGSATTTVSATRNPVAARAVGHPATVLASTTPPPHVRSPPINGVHPIDATGLD